MNKLGYYFFAAIGVLLILVGCFWVVEPLTPRAGAFLQSPFQIHFVTVDPAGACPTGGSYFITQNIATGLLTGCVAGTWGPLTGGGGGGGSVFTGSTAITSTFSATPTFSLADISVKSPVRFQPGAMTANVTSVGFTSLTAGAKFSILWTQDGTGGRTVTYGGTANNTCTVVPFATVATLQLFEVAADGSTVNGAGCIASGGPDAFGSETIAPGTPPANTYMCWSDSTDHSGWECKANNSTNIFKMVLSGADINTGTGTVTGVNGASVGANIAAVATNSLGQLISGSGTPTQKIFTDGSTATKLCANAGDAGCTLATAGQTNFGGPFAGLTIAGSSFTANRLLRVTACFNSTASAATPATTNFSLFLAGVKVQTTNAQAVTASTAQGHFCAIWLAQSTAATGASVPIWTGMNVSGPTGWTTLGSAGLTSQPQNINTTSTVSVVVSGVFGGTLTQTGNYLNLEQLFIEGPF